MNTTISNQKTEPLTIEILKKAALLVKKYKPNSYKRSWFTRLMNRLGWHRRYEVIILKKSFFQMEILKVMSLIIEKIKEIPIKYPEYESDDYDRGCRDMQKRIINLLKKLKLVAD